MTTLSDVPVCSLLVTPSHSVVLGKQLKNNHLQYFEKNSLTTTEKAIKNFELYYQKTLEDFSPNEVFADDDQYQPDLLQNTTIPNIVKRNLKPGQQHPKYHKVHENRFD